MKEYQPFEAVKYLNNTGESDPLRYYTKPIVGAVFRKRITLGLDLLRGSKFNKLVEIGYGSGFLMPYWTNISKEVFGLDIDAEPEKVSQDLRKFFDRALHLTKGDMLSMPYQDGTFDCLVAFSIMEHIKDIEAAVREISRVVKPGGKILIGMPAVNKAMDYGFKAIGFKNIDHHHVTTPKEFFEVAKKSWKLCAHKTLPLKMYHEFLFER